MHPLKKVRNTYYEKKYSYLQSDIANLLKDTYTSPDERRNDEITMQLVGHSTILINIYGTWILTDPIFSKKAGFHIGLRVTKIFERWLQRRKKWFWSKILSSIQKRKIGTKRRKQATIQIEDIHSLDYILISHAHFDHWDNDSLDGLRKKFPNVTIICPKNTSKLLHHANHKKIIEIDWEEHHDTSEISFLAYETKHRWERYLHNPFVTYKKWSKKQKWHNSYVISKNGKNIFFAGDTAYTEAFGDLPKTLASINQKSIDISIFPIAGYTWKRNHCTPEQARDMAKQMKSTWFIPMHFETFHSSKRPIYRLIDTYRKELQWKKSLEKDNWEDILENNNSDMHIGLSSIGEIFIYKETHNVYSRS